MTFGTCGDCGRESRLFEFLPGHDLCLTCLRGILLEKVEDIDDAP